MIGEEPAGATLDKTKLEVVMRGVYKYAVEGRPWAVMFIADRTEGKAVERVAIQERRAIEDMTDEELDALLGK